MDEISTSFEPESGDQTPDEQASWFSGFIDIFSAPWEIGRRAIRSPMKVVILAILLQVASVPVISYFNSSSPGVVKEMHDKAMKKFNKLAENPNITPEVLAQQREIIEESINFNFTMSLWMGLGIGLLNLFVLGSLLWISHRMFTAEPLGYVHLVSLVSYGASIDFIGNIVRALMMFVGDSIRYSPNLLFLNTTDATSMITLLSRIDVFYLWFYVAVGLAIASAAGLTRKYGFYISGVIYMFITLSSWGILRIIEILGFG
jgi:hypothetical protein